MPDVKYTVGVQYKLTAVYISSERQTINYCSIVKMATLRMYYPHARWANQALLPKLKTYWLNKEQ